MKDQLNYLIAPAESAVPLEKVAEGSAMPLPHQMSTEGLAEMLGTGLNTEAGRLQLYEEVKTAAEVVRQDAAGLKEGMVYKAAAVQDLAKQALLEGNTPEEVVRVMLSGLAVMGDLEKDAALMVTKSTMEKLGRDVKTANIPWHREPTPDHELTVAVGELVKAALNAQERALLAANLEHTMGDIRGRLRGESC